MPRVFFSLLLLFLFSLVLTASAEDNVETTPPPSSQTTETKQPSYKVIKRTPKIEMYRCDECHETKKDYNAKPRKLEEEHAEIKIVHVSDEEQDWCLRCHKENNYNKLFLQNGEVISFNESYRLCRECHSAIYNDWLPNAHGKRIGSWQGSGEAYSCTECHDAHDPEFKPMQAKDPPIRPVKTFWGL